MDCVALLSLELSLAVLSRSYNIGFVTSSIKWYAQMEVIFFSFNEASKAGCSKGVVTDMELIKWRVVFFMFFVCTHVMFAFMPFLEVSSLDFFVFAW